MASSDTMLRNRARPRSSQRRTPAGCLTESFQVSDTLWQRRVSRMTKYPRVARRQSFRSLSTGTDHGPSPTAKARRTRPQPPSCSPPCSPTTAAPASLHGTTTRPVDHSSGVPKGPATPTPCSSCYPKPRSCWAPAPSRPLPSPRALSRHGPLRQGPRLRPLCASYSSRRRWWRDSMMYEAAPKIAARPDKMPTVEPSSSKKASSDTAAIQAEINNHSHSFGAGLPVISACLNCCEVTGTHGVLLAKSIRLISACLLEADTKDRQAVSTAARPNNRVIAITVPIM